MRRNDFCWNARCRARHRATHSRAPPRVTAVVPPYHGRPEGSRASRGAGVSRARAPSLALGRVPRWPRAAWTPRRRLPPCQAHMSRPPHAPLGSWVPTSLRSLASKHSIARAYKWACGASRAGTPPPEHHGRRRAELPLRSLLRSSDRSNPLPRSYRSSKLRVFLRSPPSLAAHQAAAAGAAGYRRTPSSRQPRPQLRA
jgi:hypothetical protein